MAKRLNVDPVSFEAYRGVPRGASVLFTPKRTVGVRGGTSRDALTAASRHALKAVLETLTETTRPVEGASCKFVRHSSMDAVDRKMRVDGRNELRRQRQRQARAKARAARATEAAASTAEEVLQHRASRESL